MNERGSGILLHITSLPSAFGIGDLGPSAYRFGDYLAGAGQRYWQILPLNPTDPLHGNSPYHSHAAFAGNPLLISPETLVRDGWIGQVDLPPPTGFSSDHVDYGRVISFKEALLQKAYQRFTADRENGDYDVFCGENANWLDDYALFVALKSHFKGKVWSEWPAEFRDREGEALGWAGQAFADRIRQVKFLQFLLYTQWAAVKGHFNHQGIRIIGDLPIYVVHDSADVWVHPELFHLDETKRPVTVAGVPPDYFSETGQLWGNPVYRWEALKAQGYEWWIRRLRHNLKLYDLVRVDHFRGFVGYWEIPAGERNAIQGQWVEAPAWDFFTRITEVFNDLPIIAEDLGVITPDVTEVRRHFQFPGMKILLFAFGEDLPTHPYAPHNLERDCVVYTGTHDNNTARGWFENETSPETRERLFRYLGREVLADRIGQELIRLAMMSAADRVIFPLQDLLGLGKEARMNRPAREDGNWEWRLDPAMLTPALAKDLREMTEIYGRV
jgi:4-alpha-glucanotransferase